MKKRFRILALILSAVMAMAAALSGCGSSAPTDTDAKKYVQAVIDLICLGEYDKSVDFADLEDGKELEMREEMIDEMLDSFTGEITLDDETKKEFKDCILRAFSCCKYTVGEAVKTDDDGSTGYDVTVSIEPLRVFDGANEAMEAEIEELTGDVDKLMNMTEEEMNAQVFEAVFEKLNKNLEEPAYDAAKEIVVHYGLMNEETNAYGISYEDGQKIGESLFSLDGVE